MPVYDYHCYGCSRTYERIAKIAERDMQNCDWCGQPFHRIQGAPLFRFKGRVTPGGGPDKFTADMLGMRLDELPSGLRTEKK
jgi:putative FmdB family regulatory protein